MSKNDYCVSGCKGYSEEEVKELGNLFLELCKKRDFRMEFAGLGVASSHAGCSIKIEFPWNTNLEKVSASDPLTALRKVFENND